MARQLHLVHDGERKMEIEIMPPNHALQRTRRGVAVAIVASRAPGR